MKENRHKTGQKKKKKQKEEIKELYLWLRVNQQLLMPYLDHDAVFVTLLDKRK